MAELKVIRPDGQDAGVHTVGDKLANATAKLVTTHRAVVAEEANSRQGTQKTKTRSETRGGGRKPYKQKKTGNARQGSIRAPQWAHGGMALAITPRDYDKKVNRKEKRAAILGALSAQIEAGHVTVVETIAFAAPKTKDAQAMLLAAGIAKGQRRILVILPQVDDATYKSFRNLPNVEVRTAPSTEPGAKTSTFSTRDLLLAQRIVVAKDALARIEEVWAK